MRHGRRSRPILLNLGVRRLVGVEHEVDTPLYANDLGDVE